jgi:hypothetical protein
MVAVPSEVASLAKEYSLATKRLASEDKLKLRATRQIWLRYRNSCTDPEMQRCLLERMTARYQELIRHR